MAGPLLPKIRALSKTLSWPKSPGRNWGGRSGEVVQGYWPTLPVEIFGMVEILQLDGQCWRPGEEVMVLASARLREEL